MNLSVVREGAPSHRPASCAASVDASFDGGLDPAAAARIESWRPRLVGSSDEADLDVVLPVTRVWVAAANPNESAAGSLMRAVSGLALWGYQQLGTLNPETVLSVHNIEYWSMTANAHRSVTWRDNTRSLLRRVSRAVNPHLWPRRPTAMRSRPTVEPYTAQQEAMFVRCAGLSRSRGRAARLWLVCACFGVGMSGTEAAMAAPDDVVEMESGRLGVAVRGTRPRLVPVRAAYTATVREALRCRERDTFLRGGAAQASALAASMIADPRVRPDTTKLSLRRARSTWLAAHLLAGTPLPALRAIAGPLSSVRLDALIEMLGHSLDTETAVQEAMRA